MKRGDRRGIDLHKIGEFGVTVDDQAMDLIFDLVLLGVLEGDVVLGQTGLPLPVLQQYESDLRIPTTTTSTSTNILNYPKYHPF